MPIVKCCAGCAEKLRSVRQPGKSEAAYILTELREEPRPGICPLCFMPARLGLYELTKIRTETRRRSGGGERARASGR